MNRLKVFILEDDPYRMRIFREDLFEVADITHAGSCTEIEKFQPPYDFIFLDHDLGGRQMEENEDSGTTFARLIKDQIQNSNIPIVIHSYNQSGAQRMLDILSLPFAQWMPFGGVAFSHAIEFIRETCKNANTTDSEEALGKTE